MDETKQRTAKGTEIPIPKRGDWDKVLERAAKPKKDSPPSRPKENRLEHRPA